MGAQERTGGPARGDRPPGRWASFAEELAFHETLLHRAAPTATVAVHRGRAVSFGVGVPPDAPYLFRARDAGIPTVRRTSGGSGVLHLEGDLLWAVVLPRSDPRVGADFTRAYGRLGRGLVTGLAAVGIPAAWAAAPGVADDYCFLSGRGEVLSVGGKVVGGAAQHLTSRALLHHGSVAWEVDRPEIDRLFDLAPGGPSALLGGLAGAAGRLDPAAVAEALTRALDAELAP